MSHREAKYASLKVSCIGFDLLQTISHFWLFRTCRLDATLWPPLRCRPLATIGRPPLPSLREVMCGEWCKEAFGTCIRIAGSFVSVASPAVPLGGNRHYSLPVGG
jgi:hypothetical protein